MSKYNMLLGFSGGGVRGCIATVWLDRLVSAGKIDLDKIYSISGTSTGAIIAAALCRPEPYSPADITDLFTDLSKEIFKRKSWRPAWLDSILFFAPHDIKKLNEVLTSSLGNHTVGDCQRKFVCVTYSLNSKLQDKSYASSPVIVHSHGSPFRFDYSLDLRLSDAVTGSCAAPSFFEPFHFEHNGKSRVWTDGGMCSNASILSNYQVCRDEFAGEEIPRKKITALLIGNGSRYSHESKESLAGWKTPRMLRAIKNSIVQANELYEIKSLRRFLGSRFFYLNYPLQQEISLDDYKRIDYMCHFAELKKLTHVKAWLNGYFI